MGGLTVTAAAAYGAMRMEGVMRFLVNRPLMVKYEQNYLSLLCMSPLVLRCLFHWYNWFLHDLPCNALYCGCHATQVGLICCFQFSDGCNISTTDPHGRHVKLKVVYCLRMLVNIQVPLLYVPLLTPLVWWVLYP